MKLLRLAEALSAFQHAVLAHREGADVLGEVGIVAGR